MASGKSHFLFFSQGGPALINASTGLENELPETMPVFRQGLCGFTIYTSQTNMFAFDVLLCPSFLCTWQTLTSVGMGDLKKVRTVSVFSHMDTIKSLSQTPPSRFWLKTRQDVVAGI